MELYFVMTSLWTNKIYYMFGFLFLCYGLMIITTAATTVLLVYFLLCAENYRWHWRAFAGAGMTGGYVFLNALLFWATRVSFGGLTGAVLYVGYSALIGFIVFILTGKLSFPIGFIFPSLIMVVFLSGQAPLGFSPAGPSCSASTVRSRSTKCAQVKGYSYLFSIGRGSPHRPRSGLRGSRVHGSGGRGCSADGGPWWPHPVPMRSATVFFVIKTWPWFLFLLSAGVFMFGYPLYSWTRGVLYWTVVVIPACLCLL